VKRNGKDCRLALRFVAEGEKRVLRQKELIAQLAGRGKPLEDAEVSLHSLETMLRRLLIHLDIMQELMREGR
jgi:hypothetical protein